MDCRFEERLAGAALRLDGFLARIEARAAAEVGPALAAIHPGPQPGHRVSQQVDYQKGEWELAESNLPAPRRPWTPPRDDSRARLSALVLESNNDEPPMDAPA
ncbi:aminodeoxychorismate synthase component 1, partial [Achromobacter xylosoxidans]